MRLVAKYAQACNLFAGPDVGRKLGVLRRHCDAVGRNYDEIEKTVSGRIDPGSHGEHAGEFLNQLRELAKLGITHYHGAPREAASITPLDVIGRRIIPAAAEL